MNPQKHIFVLILLLLAGLQVEAAHGEGSKTAADFKYCLLNDSFNQPSWELDLIAYFRPNQGLQKYRDTTSQYISPCDQILEEEAFTSPPGSLAPKVLCMLAEDLAKFPELRKLFDSAENVGGKFVRAWEALSDWLLLRTNVIKLRAVSDFSLAKNIDPSLVKTELNALSNYKDDLIKSFEISNGTLPHPLITNKGVVQTDGNLLGRLVNGQFVPVGNANAAGTMDYVIMQSGEILLGSKHTFLSGGADVLAAGTVKFNSGSIKAITNASGHYLPTPGEGMNFLRLFKASGADISDATLSMYHDVGTLFKEILPSSPVRKLYD